MTDSLLLAHLQSIEEKYAPKMTPSLCEDDRWVTLCKIAMKRHCDIEVWDNVKCALFSPLPATPYYSDKEHLVALFVPCVCSFQTDSVNWDEPGGPYWDKLVAKVSLAFKDKGLRYVRFMSFREERLSANRSTVYYYALYK